jgi:hypothetical protein
MLRSPPKAQEEKGKEAPRGGSVRNRVYKAGQLDVHHGVVAKKKVGNTAAAPTAKKAAAGKRAVRAKV